MGTNSESPLSSTKTGYPLSISIVDKNIQETGLKIKIAFSHFKTEAVYLFISFETPAGTILIDPQKHYSYGVIHDMDNFIDSISEWLKNDSEKLNIGSYEELFCIEIKRPPQYNQYNKEIFLFAMSIDAAKILSNTSSEGCFGVSVVVNEKSIEELIGFFKEIKRLHELYKIESPELFI